MTDLGGIDCLRADAAITSAAGHPLDLTFTRRLKGLQRCEHIVKPGGNRYLVMSACSEGIGSPRVCRKALQL